MLVWHMYCPQGEEMSSSRLLKIPHLQIELVCSFWNQSTICFNSDQNHTATSSRFKAFADSVYRLMEDVNVSDRVFASLNSVGTGQAVGEHLHFRMRERTWRKPIGTWPGAGWPHKRVEFRFIALEPNLDCWAALLCGRNSLTQGLGPQNRARQLNVRGKTLCSDPSLGGGDHWWITELGLKLVSVPKLPHQSLGRKHDLKRHSFF